MKGITKGKFLKKIKSIKPIDFLKQDRILQAFALDGYIELFTKNENLNVQTQLSSGELDQMKLNKNFVTLQEPDIIDVSELMRDLDDEEIKFPEDGDDKENIGPPIKTTEIEDLKEKPKNLTCSEPELLERGVLEDSNFSSWNNLSPTPILSEIDISSFQRPELESCTLFDPNLLAAFHQAVKEHIKMNEAERKSKTLKSVKLETNDPETPSKSHRIEGENPLLTFQEKCPPGGLDSVILYTTTLRGIRKTFEDCSSVRFLLQSFRVAFHERDVSMHAEFREELWRILDGKELPPKLFIKGRYIGGAEEVLGLHEQGKLRVLFNGVQIDGSNGPCEGCFGIRFVVCLKCSGSRKFVCDEGLLNKCSECNENGLILCPVCC